MENTASPSTGAQSVQPNSAPNNPAHSIIACQIAAGFISYWEGFLAVAKWDVNHYRLGFGSDTEGPEQFNVVQGMTTTRARALANLALRIPAYADKAENLLAGLWPALGVCTQVAVLDMVYNYGTIPASVLAAFLHSPHSVADAIRNHDSDNASVNRDRRAAEAGLVIFDGGQVQ